MAERSFSKKVEMLAASEHDPIRGAVAFKSTVSNNLTSDARANLSCGGKTGGADG